MSATPALSLINKKASLTKWVYLLTLSLIWGSSFILIKKGLTGFGYFEAATIRLMSAGLAFLPFGWSNFAKIPRTQYGYVVLTALLGMFVPAFLFCLAQMKVQSSVAAMLNGLTPVFTFVFSIFIFRIAYKLNQVLGLLLGLGCAILLAVERSATAISFNWHAGLIILAALCYGFNINLIKQRLSHIPAIVLSTVTVSITGLLAFFLAFLPNIGQYHPGQIEWMPLLALAVLGVFGTAIAQLIQYKLIKETSALFASSTTYIIPVVAVFWGVMDGEQFQLVHALSIAGILAAIVLIRKS
ncbi:MAG: DMT family transporter [Saprospiraceae bacterium]